MSSEISRPALRYHGGKWKLAPWIIEHFPTHEVFTDSFGGGCNIIIRKERSYAEVYNDLNSEVVNFFRVLRDPGQAADLRRLLELTPFARVEFKDAYAPAPSPVESARRLVIRSFMGFGSASVNSKHQTGFRANSNRSGSTPARDWVTYVENLPALTARLQGVIIENRDALEVIRQHDAKTTLHYVDPPYLLSTRGNNSGVRQKYVHELSDAHHVALSHELHQVKGMVVLSGYASDLYDKHLFPHWKRVEKITHADGARDRIEVLWLNEAASNALKFSPRQLALDV